jgi:Zn-finger nucleic acid-binding protein
MKCPTDGSDLVMSERQGIEIDYCPKCRGVWLDRGELDKIIERSEASPPPPRAAAPVGQMEHQQPRYDQQYDQHDQRPSQHVGQRHDQRHRKKKSFLGDIFDFD